MTCGSILFTEADSICVTCYMAYILIFSIFLPSLNNTVFIFLHILLSICLHRSLNSYVSVLPRASLRYINRLNWARLFSHRPAPALTTPLQDWSPPRLHLLLDAHSQMRRGRSCCVSSKWPQASWSQVSLAMLCPCHQEAQFLIASQPCTVHAIKRHQTLIASQHCHLLDSIVFTLDWCSQCTPQAGTVTKSYCMPQAGNLTNSYCTPQAGTVTKSYRTPLSGTLTNSYCTPQAGTVTKSYCTPLAGTLTNSNCTPQAGTVTNSYCTPLAGTVTHSSCTPQAGTATNLKTLFCLLILTSKQRSLSSLQPFKRKITYFCMYVI